MITLRLKKHTEKWFSNDILISDMFKLIIYKQSNLIEKKIGFIKEPFYTFVIDLTQNIDDIFSKIKKNTKYEINRASREGVKFEIHNDIEYFIDYYNKFAATKNLSKLNNANIDIFKENIIVTKAINENDDIYVMHSYIFDKEKSVVRLFHSASFYETDDKKVRNLIGMANRFLHYEDMKYFKNDGFETYDFGGYAYNTTDKHLQNINDFKLAFGGISTQQSNYYSLVFYLALKIKSLIGK
jgi:lipid II:glycine glycyltransferase (peptidoglycan interpeptide bridge formation enzyme)